MDILNKLNQVLNVNPEIEKFEVDLLNVKKANDFNFNNDQTVFKKMVDLLSSVKADIPKATLKEYDNILLIANGCVYKKSSKTKK